MSDIQQLTHQSETISSELEIKTQDLMLPKANLILSDGSKTSLKTMLTIAKDSQQKNSKAFEDDEKRFKVIVKYGDILRKIEKLLGLMPTDLSNLSLDELENKLKELLENRKKNTEQLAYIFYQNMLSDLLTNLANIENDYQSGVLSSQEALSRVQQSKQMIKNNVQSVPNELSEPLKNASDLVKLYENSFKQEIERRDNQTPTPLIETKLKLEHQLLFERINTSASYIVSRVEGLTKDLANFEPEVNVEELTSNLKSTQDIFYLDTWNVDEASAAISSLDSTVDGLIDEQLAKNKVNANLTEEIQHITDKSSHISLSSTQNVTEQTFTEANNRAEQAISNVEVVSQLEAQSGSVTTFQTQFANATLSQLETDKDISDTAAFDPNASTAFKDDSLNAEAQEAASDLNEKVEKRELEQGHIKHLEFENNSTDEDEEKRPKNPYVEEDPNNSGY